MRTIDKIMKGEDRTMFILKSQMSFKFFGDRVLGLNIEPHHEQWVDMVENNKRVLIIAFTGSGKSIRRGTKVIMYDGSIKKAEDVKQNDLLMGDDSTPRKVLQTTEGFGKIYTIKQKNGNDYQVNDSHILSLKYTNCHVKSLANKYINISIDEYHKLENYKKQWLKGYKVPIDFEEKPVTLEPYFLGCWAGDGRKDTQALSISDNEISKYLKEYTKRLNYNISEYKAKGCISYNIIKKKGKQNYILEQLRKYNLINNKHIPNEYKYNSRAVRLQVLAGLIDTDGYNSKNTLDFTFKGKQFSDDIVYLCRSLGFRATISECTKSIKSIGFTGTYYRITVSGNLDEIPTLVKRKQFSKRKMNKDPLVCGMSVIDENIQDNWYGFVLDGNKRFLLGDFTVTHNSEIMAIAYPLWKIFKTHKWDALIISKSMKQATSLLDRIKSAISENELLKDLIPKKDTWNKTEINTRNKCNISCVPYNENVKGYHVNYVLADEASSYVDKDIYYRFVETRVNSKNGTVCLITTPQHPSDLSQDLIDNPYYAIQVLKVIDEDNNPVSERFPMSRITEIRRSNEMSFRKEYLCDVSVASETPFDMNDIIACFDDNRIFTLRHEDYIGVVYSGHDFAVSKVGDYSVSVFIDKVGEDMVLKYVERTRGVSLPEQESRLVELHGMLHPVTMLVDESNMGQGIKQHLIDKIPIQGQLFSPARRHELLMNLKRAIETGHLIIPHGEDELTSTIIDELVKELSSFKSTRTPSGQQTLQARSKHDDLVFGLAMAVKAATSEMEFVDYIATDYQEITDMTNVL